ncbi:uncharacterized protein KGF55_005601 [Candida pseudojiufengensis]|uniref:uncharacterized protein n=1 Tax=Candida pseudojiufengensis TaxID=497109 RepID=UPI002225AAEE|nr:uncharacterized protein KGF55_005601 [Candida pseudojiufengensis]KAI5958947.1 hypothetical protein KGF55_005601 [Candida pseudojiufengensis]
MGNKISNYLIYFRFRFCLFCKLYLLCFSLFYNYLPTMGDCHGTELAAAYGYLILSSYLVLFISFYINVYKSKGSSSAGSKKNGLEKKVVEEEEIKSKSTGVSSSSTKPKSRKV